MGIEIEKKYTVKTLPSDLSAYTCHVIEQAYLNTDPVVRIRKDDDTYILTYKGEGLLAREEYNLPLNKQSYYHLREKADGNIISKKRYLIPLSTANSIDQHGRNRGSEAQPEILSPEDAGLVIELDIFDAPFAPLVVAEVEFPDLEAAEHFQPPDWFAADVTMNPEYKNSYLSRKVTN